MEFRNIRKELSLAWYMTKTNFYNEAALRGSFLLTVFGMFLNDFAFLFIWIFFFKSFGTINGWSVNETIGMQGFAALVYGLCHTFGGGINQLSRKIDNGSFDNFLLRPRSLYATIVTGAMETSAIGDLIFGASIMAVYAVLAHLSGLQIFMMITLTIPATLVFLNTHLLSNMVAFIFPDAQNLGRNIFEIVLTPGLYPAALYQGVMRFMFFFIIPALAVGGMPVEAVRDISPVWYAWIWVIAIFWTLITTAVLNFAVKRYESGNLIGSRD